MKHCLNTVFLIALPAGVEGRQRFAAGNLAGGGDCWMLKAEGALMSDVLHVTVTGAAGQVAYAMLGRLASGEVFGAKQKIILQLLDITPQLQVLEGVAMEL